MRSLNEKCAVIAICHTDYEEVARNAYLGLWAMQHRGQDSSGIASFDGIKLHHQKGSGLVTQVYDEESLDSLKGTLAVGHNRYSTSGGNDDFLNQPFVNEGLGFAFAHNGNLPFTDKLNEYMIKHKMSVNGHNDSGLMALALSNELRKTNSIQKAVKACWPLFTGAFCCVGMYKDELFAFRDSDGIRPLSIGKSTKGLVVASETAAIDAIGAEFVRDVEPGELVVIQGDQIKSTRISRRKQKLDAFEFVYLARPDSVLAGRSVYAARFQAGELLADDHPVAADVVLSAPDSGTPAAAGFANSSGIPFGHGIIKNRYIGRTFIEPEKIRKSAVQLKFNIIRELIDGQRIVLVDDSIVRGNTLKHLVKLLKDNGAKEVHVRIASPPVKYPDFYGIDTPSGNELIAHDLTVREIEQHIGSDSLGYLSEEDFVESTGLPREQLCMSCFDGTYPIPVPFTEDEDESEQMQLMEVEEEYA